MTAVRIRTSSGWQDIAIQGPQGVQGPEGPAGATGSAGTPGTAGTNGAPGEKWFTQAGAPAGATGIVGDWSLDSSSGDYYEKTGASAWTIRGNLRGPQGIQGVQGNTGSTGSTGSTGAAGAPGSVWRSGAGAPATGLGIVGDWYLNTSNGDVHEKTGAAVWTLRDNLTGPQGATGTTGSQGIQGPPGPSTGPAGGDLSGTYPDPQIAAGVIVNADVAAAAAIAESKLALASDAAAGTASRRTLGTGALQAAAGNDPRFADSRAPTGAAGGDLSGTYPSPAIAAGVIVDGDVNAAAAIAESKLALATDAAAGTGSRRTIGTGALQACAGNDARLTNTRAPTAHASTHAPGGADALTVDAAAATGSLRTLGTGATQACAGNDARLTATPATFATGSGAPTAGVGADGGVYLDYVSGRMYGPKAAGAWPATPIGRLVTDATTYDQLSTGT